MTRTAPPKPRSPEGPPAAASVLPPPSMGRAVRAMMLREISATYGRSPIGYLWAVADPVGGILLMTLLFSMLMQRPPLGESFAIFYATGILPFLLFADLSQKLGVAIRYSKPLFAYPALGLTEALLARFLLNLLTHVVIAVVALGLLALAIGLPGRPQPGPLLAGYALIALLAGGLGTLNCYLIAVSPNWERIWAIANRPLFLISGVFYTYDGVPAGFADLLWWNPLLQGIGLVRAGLYPQYSAEYVSPLYVAAIGMGALVGGLVLMARRGRDLVNE